MRVDDAQLALLMAMRLLDIRPQLYYWNRMHTPKDVQVEVRIRAVPSPRALFFFFDMHATTTKPVPITLPYVMLGLEFESLLPLVRKLEDYADFSWRSDAGWACAS